MELWKASMIPTTVDSSGCNGFGTTLISDPSPRTLSSSTTGIIATAASKGKPLYSPSTKKAMNQSCHLESLNCQESTTFPMEQSLLFVLSEVIVDLISLESILNFLKALFIPMFELKSLLVCTRFKSTRVMSWLPLFHTVCRHGLLQIYKMGNLCIDTC
jgi:hypothetical protein